MISFAFFFFFISGWKQLNVLPCKSYKRRFLLTGLRSLRLLKSMTATTQVTPPLMCAWGPAGLRLVGDTLSLLPAEDVSRGCLSLESNLEGGVGRFSMKKGRIRTREQTHWAESLGREIWFQKLKSQHLHSGASSDVSQGTGGSEDGELVS